MSLQSHVGLEVFLFENVMVLGSPEARHELAEQLVQLVADPATPPYEIRQVTPFLIRLAKDANRNTRQAIAEGLTSAASLDRELIFTILADEEDIALPFLSAAKSISSDLHQTIVRAGDELQQTVIAKLEKLDPETINSLAHHGLLEAVLELLNNQNAVLSPNDFKAIATRFENNGEVKDAMMDRPDLPLILRLKQAREATQNLRQMLAETGWMSSFAREETCKESESAALVQALSEAIAGEMLEGLDYLNRANVLNAGLIIRCAVSGKMHVFDEVLAFLSGMPLGAVLKGLYGGNNKSQRAIFTRAGLPESCFGVLCAACDVVHNTQLVAAGKESNEFGNQVLEMLMTRYERMSNVERATQLDYLGRFGQEQLRPLAQQVRKEFLRAA